MMKIDFLRLEKQTTEKGDGWAGCLDFDLFFFCGVSRRRKQIKRKTACGREKRLEARVASCAAERSCLERDLQNVEKEGLFMDFDNCAKM